MQKVGSAEINQLMLAAASTIREQQAEIDEYRKEKLARDRRDQAEKTAALAAEKGMIAPDSVTEYAAHLANGKDDLHSVHNLVTRSSGGGIPLGESFHKEASEDDETESPGDPSMTPVDLFLLNSDLAG